MHQYRPLMYKNYNSKFQAAVKTDKNFRQGSNNRMQESKVHRCKQHSDSKHVHAVLKA